MSIGISRNASAITVLQKGNPDRAVDGETLNSGSVVFFRANPEVIEP
jgi:hypothetical protein